MGGQYHRNIQLEDLSKNDLLRAISSRDEKIASLSRDSSAKDQRIDYLEAQLAMYKRMQFGQKRERFEGDPHQTMLPFETEPAQVERQQEEIREKIEYVRKRPEHKGRAKLPEHLPVEEIEIHPQGDLSQMVCIGKEITEELECEPARFYIKRYIRYKYAAKDGDGVSIAELPERVIDKGIPGAGLLAMVLTDKYNGPSSPVPPETALCQGQHPDTVIDDRGMDQAGIGKTGTVVRSTGLRHQVERLPPSGRNADKGAGRRQKRGRPPGLLLGIPRPAGRDRAVRRSPTRGGTAPLPILGSFRGYLQTDGYAVYGKYAKKKGVTHLACWAHARREFERALDNDGPRAQRALLMVQQLYAVERRAKEEDLTAEQVKELRLERSLPVINEMGKWIFEEIKNTLPKSQIGKAMAYAYARWDALSAYLYDGNLHIDNNLVENAIRPVALGRKNYLFAGSHEAAQRAAMIYSFFAICKKHDVNPFEWLKYTLENIMSINHKNLKDLYPQNYKRIIGKSNM